MVGIGSECDLKVTNLIIGLTEMNDECLLVLYVLCTLGTDSEMSPEVVDGSDTLIK